eukprot:7835394-Alexandrium_andersonii.AAC.1
MAACKANGASRPARQNGYFENRTSGVPDRVDGTPRPAWREQNSHASKLPRLRGAPLLCPRACFRQ